MLAAFVQRPLPQTSAARPILLAGAAQLVCLGMPPHAVVDLAVEAARRDRGAAKARGPDECGAATRRGTGRGPAARRGSDCSQCPSVDAGALGRSLRRRNGAAHRCSKPQRSRARHLGEAIRDRCRPVGRTFGRTAVADRLDPRCRRGSSGGIAGLYCGCLVGPGRGRRLGYAHCGFSWGTDCRRSLCRPGRKNRRSCRCAGSCNSCRHLAAAFRAPRCQPTKA